MRKFSTHTHRHPMTVNYHIACNSITFNFRPLSINRIAHVQSSFSTTVCYAKQVSYSCTKCIDERLRVKFVRYILTLPQYCQSLPSQSHSISLYFLHYSLVELNLFFDKINFVSDTCVYSKQFEMNFTSSFILYDFGSVLIACNLVELLQFIELRNLPYSQKFVPKWIKKPNDLKWICGMWVCGVGEFNSLANGKTCTTSLLIDHTKKNFLKRIDCLLLDHTTEVENWTASIVKHLLTLTVIRAHCSHTQCSDYHCIS